MSLWLEKITGLRPTLAVEAYNTQTTGSILINLLGYSAHQKKVSHIYSWAIELIIEIQRYQYLTPDYHLLATYLSLLDISRQKQVFILSHNHLIT